MERQLTAFWGFIILWIWDKFHISCSKEAEPGVCNTPYRVTQVLNVSKYVVMTGSLTDVSQVPSGAEEYYIVNSGRKISSLTLVLAAASLVTWSWWLHWQLECLGINIL
jgi:hypothetical protein